MEQAEEEKSNLTGKERARGSDSKFIHRVFVEGMQCSANKCVKDDVL